MWRHKVKYEEDILYIYISPPVFIEFHKISVIQQNRLEVQDFQFYFEGTGKGF